MGLLSIKAMKAKTSHVKDGSKQQIPRMNTNSVLRKGRNHCSWSGEGLESREGAGEMMRTEESIPGQENERGRMGTGWACYRDTRRPGWPG